MAIATYEDPFDLKLRRQNLSLDQGPSDVILAESKGLTKAGLMTPSGTSQDPVDVDVGPQPVFDDLNDKEKQSKWELEKIGYKAKLERLTGVVASAKGNVIDSVAPVASLTDSGIDTTSTKDNKSNIKINKMGSGVDITKIEEATSLSGLSPTYLVSNRQEYVSPEYAQPVDSVHETKVKFDEWNYLHSGRQYNDTPEREVVEAKDNYLKYKNRVRKKADYLTDNVTKQKGTSSEWLIGLKNIITKGEADSYDTISRLHKNKPPKRLTEMTVAEVKKWMVQERGNDADSTSSGQYQINYVNLKELTEKKVNGKSILRDNELFNKDTQDKAYRQLLKKRGFDKFEKHMKMSGVQDPSGVKELSDKKVKAAIAMQLGLAQEWAAIPIPYDLTKEQRGKNNDGTWRYPNGLKKGQSYYEDNINTVPNVNKGVDFLNYLLSYMNIGE